MAVLEVTDVVVRYGQTTALAGVSLRVEPGEVVALIGPNGAGKTTLLEAVEGYLTPDTGTVRVFDLDPAAKRATIAARWGVMPQANGLPMGLTVEEAVSLFAGLYGTSESIASVLHATNLGNLARRKWRRLSGGEQQRLSLALALVGGNDLLLLDEPTAAVDQAGRDQILALIKERTSAGTAVVITTHRFDDVEACADRVVVLDQGTIVASGTLDELTSVTNAITFRAAPGLSTGSIGASVAAQVTEPQAGHYSVALPPTAANVAELARALASLDIAIDALDAGRTSIEAVFRTLTGEEGA